MRYKNCFFTGKESVDAEETEDAVEVIKFIFSIPAAQHFQYEMCAETYLLADIW